MRADIVEEIAGKRTVLFEHGGRRKFTASASALIALAHGEVPPDHPLRRREQWARVERGASFQSQLQALPNRIGPLVSQFEVSFPNGLRSSECDEVERDYKMAHSERVRRLLAPDELKRLRSKAPSDVFARMRSALHFNLVNSFEQVKFADVPQAAHAEIASVAIDFVTADADVPAAIERLGESLRPFESGKWTVCTLVPSMLAPSRWPFVKPTAVRRAADVLGVDISYEAQPSAQTYRNIMGLYAEISRLLESRGAAWAPRDFIDVNTFLWYGTGMAREAIQARDED